jgi:hypothetical protein
MALLVLAGGVSKAHTARSVPAKIVARRVERYQAEGRAGMTDRSFRPLAMPAIEAGCRSRQRRRRVGFDEIASHHQFYGYTA